MNDALITLRQVDAEQKTFWRNPAGAFFGFFFPLMFLLIFGTIFKDGSVCLGGAVDRFNRCHGGISVPYNQYFVPSMMVFGVVGACYLSIAMTVTIRRDSGILKRIRGTPLPSWSFFAGVLGSSLIVALILSVLIMAVGRIVYGAPLPEHPLPVVAALIAGALCFCALGIAVTTFIPNADAAPAIVNGVYFPIVFVSGIFYPIGIDWLNTVADIFPVRHFQQAVLFGFDPARNLSASGWTGDHLAVMGAWTVAALLVATARFRWEPART